MKRDSSGGQHSKLYRNPRVQIKLSEIKAAVDKYRVSKRWYHLTPTDLERLKTFYENVDTSHEFLTTKEQLKFIKLLISIKNNFTPGFCMYGVIQPLLGKLKDFIDIVEMLPAPLIHKHPSHYLCYWEKDKASNIAEALSILSADHNAKSYLASKIHLDFIYHFSADAVVLAKAIVVLNDLRESEFFCLRKMELASKKRKRKDPDTKSAGDSSTSIILSDIKLENVVIEEDCKQVVSRPDLEIIIDSFDGATNNESVNVHSVNEEKAAAQSCMPYSRWSAQQTALKFHGFYQKSPRLNRDWQHNSGEMIEHGV